MIEFFKPWTAKWSNHQSLNRKKAEYNKKQIQPKLKLRRDRTTLIIEYTSPILEAIITISIYFLSQGLKAVYRMQSTKIMRSMQPTPNKITLSKEIWKLVTCSIENILVCLFKMSICPERETKMYAMDIYSLIRIENSILIVPFINSSRFSKILTN